jgi:hypothetical protein
MIGRVTNSEIKKNRDGDEKVVLLQVEITDSDDVQTVELMTPPGVNSNPVDGSIVFIAQVGSAFKVALVADDGIEPTADRGEHEIYASEGGVKKSSAFCKKDGTLVLNFGDDFAVRFNKLKEAFDQLKADFNTAVSQYNLHTHNGSVPVPTLTQTPSTADIDPAKIDDILVPEAP